jgi:hypothetical protein
MPDLSILIPARNELFLSRTIEDILANMQADTEILVGLDGLWSEPPIKDSPRVTIVHTSVSLGQRAMTNKLCALSQARYVMKVDAHCAFARGFDATLLEDMQDSWTMAPLMKNLHAFDWVCNAGHRRYQGPSGPCAVCGEPTVMDVVWHAKDSPNSTSYCFDSEPHFQYFSQYKKRPGSRGPLTESMSLQGSCFMLTRERYNALNICDEAFGSWGSQGIEVACKTWLSGGTVVVSHKTWYAHMFRTQGGDFGFPYPLSGQQVSHAKAEARRQFFTNTWPLQTRPLSWLVERFWPVPGWSEEQLAQLKGVPMQTDVMQPLLSYAPADSSGEVPSVSHEPPPSVVQQPTTTRFSAVCKTTTEVAPTRGILYYTDNCINMRLSLACRSYIARSGLPITSVTLKPTEFGRNFVYKGVRGYKTMFRQIELGLASMTEDFVYFCEHDVLYHPNHFTFVPERSDCWYYAGNWWQVRLSDGFAVSYDISPLSGLVVDRRTALTHFQERNAMIEQKGFGYWMGFEPFTHRRVKWLHWYDYEVFQPPFPNIDLAHDTNQTRKRFTQDSFIRKPKFWNEGDAAHIPGWPELPKLIKNLRASAVRG